MSEHRSDRLRWRGGSTYADRAIEHGVSQLTNKGDMIEMLETLRQGSDYELLELYHRDNRIIHEVAEEQKAKLAEEIAQLKKEADELKEEIEGLDPAGVEGIF